MRAQTTLDFAAGMSLFLLAVAFVFAFVPGLTGSFTDGGGEAYVASDRVADGLGKDALASDREPYVLDVSCTTAFFDLGGAPPKTCRFNGATLHDRVGLSDRLRLNVRIEGADADGDGAPDVLCNDGTGDVVPAGDPAEPCATAFAAGDTPPSDTGSVVLARRTVSIDGRDATLLVRAW